MHQGFLLLNFLVPLVPLLHHALLKAMKLGLRHLFGMVGVVREEEKLLVVALLCLQCPLDGRQLIIEADALVLEPLHDRLVGLPDTLGLVVLDHGLVQSILQHPDLPHLRGVLRLRQLRVHGELIVLAVQLVHVQLLLHVLSSKLIEFPLQTLHFGHPLRELLLCGLRLLVPDLRYLTTDGLVLLLHLLNDLLVLLDIQLRSLIGSLALTLEQLKSPLQVLQLLLGRHRCLGHVCQQSRGT
mmetsp:Transcript_24512/g.54553  ORF Transcript_24512/g.54553 Transcript_24512/m.54553 type:complete len:241 (-) Transcript_24512:24-746(-)